jgi:hypothetical protein
MASTISLLDSINWVKPFVNWANLTIGLNGEPAVTSANQALQTIVGPPFIWPWNRSTVAFQTVPGVQSYSVAIANFGYLEGATIQLSGVITTATILSHVATIACVNNFNTLPNGGVGQTVTLSGCTTAALNSTFVLTSVTNTGFTFATAHADLSTETEPTGALALAGDTMGLELKWGAMHEARAQDRPTFIATQSCDEAGTTFLFRLMPVPDLLYQVNLTYQNSPGAFSNSNLNQVWGIPDQLEYIYNYFFAFFVFDYFDDPRAARYRQLAVAALLARQTGLSKTDRNLFLGNFLDLMKEETSEEQGSQQGVQSRGL